MFEHLIRRQLKVKVIVRLSSAREPLIAVKMFGYKIVSCRFAAMQAGFLSFLFSTLLTQAILIPQATNSIWPSRCFPETAVNLSRVHLVIDRCHLLTMLHKCTMCIVHVYCILYIVHGAQGGSSPSNIASHHVC